MNSKLPLAMNGNTMSQDGGSDGGIKPANIQIPTMNAVTGGAQNYENRMAATQSLIQTGNGSLAGGGYRRNRKTIYKRGYSKVRKVMKGCSSKKTRRYNKKKRNNNRVFRGGSNVPPTVIGGKIEVPTPSSQSMSSGQIAALKELTGGLMAAQTIGGNSPPSLPSPVASKFSGGGITRHRSTKYRRLRYKKSIGRRGRSRRYSGRR